MKKTWLRVAAHLLIPLLILMVAAWSVLSNSSPLAPFVANLFLGHMPRVSSLGTSNVSDGLKPIQESQTSMGEPDVPVPATESAALPDSTESPVEGDKDVSSETSESEPQDEMEPVADTDVSASESPTEGMTDATEASPDDNSEYTDRGVGASAGNSPDASALPEESTPVTAPEPAPAVAVSPSPAVDAVVIDYLSSEIPSWYVTDPLTGAKSAMCIKGTIRLSPETPDIRYPIAVRVGVVPWPVGNGDAYNYVLEPGQRELTYELRLSPLPAGAVAYKVKADIPPYWRDHAELADLIQVPFGYPCGPKFGEWYKSLVIKPAGDIGFFGPVDFVLAPVAMPHSISGTIYLPKGVVAPAGGLLISVIVSCLEVNRACSVDMLIPEGCGSIAYKQKLSADLAGDETLTVSVATPTDFSIGGSKVTYPLSRRVYFYSPTGSHMDMDKSVGVNASDGGDITGIDFFLYEP